MTENVQPARRMNSWAAGRAIRSIRMRAPLLSADGVFSRAAESKNKKMKRSHFHEFILRTRNAPKSEYT